MESKYGSVLILRTDIFFDFQVYTGKKQDSGTEHGLGYRVVHDLTRTITGKYHHVFCDNFFNSVKLAEDLQEDKLYICGTIKQNSSANLYF